MNAVAEREMLESQLERAAKEGAALKHRLQLALVSLQGAIFSLTCSSGARPSLQ